MSISKHVPIITIDGLSASGKGTIASRLASYLSWHLLDSGALYRAFAWGFVQDHLQHDRASYETVIDRLKVDYAMSNISPNDFLSYSSQPIGNLIRHEKWGQMASKLGAIPDVRELLLPLQRKACRLPGLVADGRDMGTVIFPDATMKFYLEADCELRVHRRFKQLKEKGIDVSLNEVRQELVRRDHRDKHRLHSPAGPGEGMIMINTTHLTAEQVFLQIIDQVNVLI